MLLLKTKYTHIYINILSLIQFSPKSFFRYPNKKTKKKKQKIRSSFSSCSFFENLVK